MTGSFPRLQGLELLISCHQHAIESISLIRLLEQLTNPIARPAGQLQTGIGAAQHKIENAEEGWACESLHAIHLPRLLNRSGAGRPA